MKKRFIVANWKSNKLLPEALEWLVEIKKTQIPDDKEVIVCAPFTFLSDMKKAIQEHQLFVKLGAQDISAFNEGAYTGEVCGRQIKELAEYVLVGHSERQKYFGETRQLVEKKITQAQEAALIPIVCVPNDTTSVPKGLPFVTYEPPTSISPGIPDTPENASSAAEKIKNEFHAQHVLYGGNVTSENVKSFIDMPFLDGVLVGRASLNAEEFAQIIENA